MKKVIFKSGHKFFKAWPTLDLSTLPKVPPKFGYQVKKNKPSIESPPGDNQGSSGPFKITIDKRGNSITGFIGNVTQTSNPNVYLVMPGELIKLNINLLPYWVLDHIGFEGDGVINIGSGSNPIFVMPHNDITIVVDTCYEPPEDSGGDDGDYDQRYSIHFDVRGSAGLSDLMDFYISKTEGIIPGEAIHISFRVPDGIILYAIIPVYTGDKTREDLIKTTDGINEGPYNWDFFMPNYNSIIRFEFDGEKRES